MHSVNRMIMREIHNEQSDLSSSASGSELFGELQKETDLTQDTLQLLWRCRNQQRTFCGNWVNNELTEENDENPEISALKNRFYQAMLLSGLEFDASPETDPHSMLVEHLKQAMFIDHPLTTEEVYTFLASLIECEIIAPWLLVCPVYGHTYEEMAFTNR